jgi:glutamate--cysteine ligase
MPRQGLAAPWRGGTLRDIVPDVLAIAQDGLRARGLTGPAGEDEQVFLAPLQEIADGRPTQAEHWLAQYHGAWRGDASRIFAEAAI